MGFAPCSLLFPSSVDPDVAAHQLEPDSRCVAPMYVPEQVDGVPCNAMKANAILSPTVTSAA